MDHILRVSESGKLLPSWIELGSFYHETHIEADCLRVDQVTVKMRGIQGEFVRKHADSH